MLPHERFHPHCSASTARLRSQTADRYRPASFVAAQLRRLVGRAARRPSPLEGES